MKAYKKDLYPFRSRWIELNGHQIHYIDEGEGPLIVFSHAPLGSSFMYREMIMDLSKDHRCVALDYPGFGLSPFSQCSEASIEYWSIIFWKFMDGLGMDDVILLGHDTGGAAAFKVAVDHPDRFLGIIISDAITFPTQEYPKIDRMLSIVGAPLFQWINANTNLLVRLTLRFGVPSRKISKAERLVYYQLFRTKADRRLITEMLASLRNSETLMQRVKAGFESILVDKPILLLNGDKDPVYQLGIPQRIQKMVRNASLALVSGEGHFPHVGRPVEVSRVIRHWIDDRFNTSKHPPFSVDNNLLSKYM